MLIPMLKAIHKMLEPEGSVAASPIGRIAKVTSQDKVDCARDVLEELIKGLEGTSTPTYGSTAISIDKSSLSHDIEDIKRELLG